jgi:hypothetical protein
MMLLIYNNFDITLVICTMCTRKIFMEKMTNVASAKNEIVWFQNCISI